ncbi:MAG TPA: TonB-dependent receptor [Caulobacteraceae bacterium]|jgi:outer membrane receptor protein involved in Fe transport
MAPAAFAAPAGVTFDVPAGPLGPALIEYARQAHRQVFYETALMKGRTTPGLQGRYTEDEALTRLLAGSGIVVDHTGPNVIVLKPPVIAADPPPPAGPRPAASTEVQALVVTGAQIRNVSPISPLSTVSRDDMDREGRTTVADALQSLPQVFGGVATPATQLLGTDRLGTNDTAATGVNLRGLGATATLVLVDGHRMAGSGVTGDFADVSAIPSSAVDHVEVLLDGASALYGSDAVGGVVNIILKRHFDGAETRMLGSLTSDGGAGETQVGQTFGKSWDTGNVTVSFEYDARDALHSAQRPYTANANLTPFGGTDEDVFYAHPGNILVPNPATGAFTPEWAIPTGQNGTGLTPSSFLPGQVNLSNQREGSDVLPQQKRYSSYLSFTQQLGDRVTFDADVRFTDRDFAYNLIQAVDIFPVTKANPFFVSPNGTSSEDIGYSFADELGGLKVTGSAENWGSTGTLTFDLGRTWELQMSGAYAQELGYRNEDHILNSSFLNEALGNTAPDPATGYKPAVQGYFDPFGDGGANGRSVLAFIDSGFVHSVTNSQVATFDTKVDGTLFTLPGGDWKLAVGGQVRQESFQERNESEASKDTPTTTLTGPDERLVLAAFGELRAPIVGPDNAVPGIERLEFSVAGRVEQYPNFGIAANPKLGLLWSPLTGVKARATWGTSFRAPELTELFQPSAIGPDILPKGGTSEIVLLLTGGNRNLKPETASSWTAGVDLTPPQIPGLTLSATWFDIRFTNQIGVPVAQNLNNALNSPAYASFITALDPTNAADLAKVAALLAASTSPNASLFPPSAYAFIVNGEEVNTGGLLERGLDLSGGYDLRLGDEDRLTLSAEGTLLFDYVQQVTPNSVPNSLLNTGGEPASLRGRASAAWTRGPVQATLSVNYVGGYRDIVLDRAVASWTTADLQILWRPTNIRALTKTSLALNILNIADSSPPFYETPLGTGYDPANANPLGRVVSLQLIKRW